MKKDTFFVEEFGGFLNFAKFMERQQTTIYCSELFERFECFTTGLDLKL